MSAGIIPVSNETQSSSTRITKEGRKITYRMKVIQQPERARACGSGAKSSADRRPVDPPPIVELRVYEGPNGESDITFSYKANFFLFTSLENARHLSQGRVPAQAQPSFPVLTGTPVAGMAYLDRPTPAGYFIFPDLSVRHEGKYRLSFSLYEELKEKEDMDSEIPEHVEQQRSAHVSHRLEVRSTPFTVFSAKKFPGLTESTQLSRIVAEQGCRVRIRRDVRMRRRGGDSKGGGDDYEEGYNESTYDRRASATPDYNAQHRMGTPHQAPVNEMDRPRSTSNASNASYGNQRRQSAEQISHAYQQYATSPVTPQTPQGMYPPQSQASQWHNQPSQPVSYMPPPPSYPQQGYQAPHSQQPMAPPAYGYMPPQYPSYEQNNGRHNSVEYPQPPSGPPRSTTTPQPHMQQQPLAPQYSNQGMPPYGATAGNHGQSPTAQTSPMQASHQSMSAPNQHAQYNAPGQSPVIKQDTSPQYVAPAAPNRAPEQSQQQQEYYEGRVVPPKFAHQPQPSGATKRSYSATFDATALEQPLRQGARPSVTAHDPKYSFGMDSGGEEDISIEESAMSYRRADGTERRRRVPLVN